LVKAKWNIVKFNTIYLPCQENPLLSKLVLEFTLFCHPEPCPELVSWVVSGSQMALFCEMLNQVQHDTRKRNLVLKNQVNIKNSNKISGAFEILDQFGQQ